jgi:5'-phosphate synthase pdxT subunit
MRDRSHRSEPRVRVGVLALQGDFEAHAKALERAGGVDVRLVKRPADLEGLAGLAMPGGESTTLLKLLADEGLDESIVRFVESGGAVLGTCAGAILLSREVEHPRQRSLDLLDATIERNAYGRQVDSFTDDVETTRAGRESLGDDPLPAVFIRAPRFRAVGPEVEVLATHGGDPVLVREGRVLAATFHPELTSDTRVAELFARVAAETMAPNEARHRGVGA